MKLRCKLFGCKHFGGTSAVPLGVYRYRYPTRSARKLQFLFAVERHCEKCDSKEVKLKWIDDEISLRNRYHLKVLTGKDNFDE